MLDMRRLLVAASVAALALAGCSRGGESPWVVSGKIHIEPDRSISTEGVYITRCNSLGCERRLTGVRHAGRQLPEMWILEFHDGRALIVSEWEWETYEPYERYQLPRRR